MPFTKNQENKYTMFKTVDALLDNNATIVASVPMLGLKQTALKTRITDIGTKGEEKDTLLAGKAQDKYDAEDALIKATLRVAGPMLAYGIDNNLNDVIEIAH